jgi:hypothetical protein
MTVNWCPLPNKSNSRVGCMRRIKHTKFHGLIYVRFYILTCLLFSRHHLWLEVEEVVAAEGSVGLSLQISSTNMENSNIWSSICSKWQYFLCVTRLTRSENAMWLSLLATSIIIIGGSWRQ